MPSPETRSGLTSLQSAWERRRDQFDRLRLIAAGLVIYGHSDALAAPGHAGTDLLLRLTRTAHAGEIAVWMFFVISGFLLTMRWRVSPRPLRFVRNRALRILPAYAICLLLCVLVLGPLLTRLPLAEYFGSPATWAYLLGNLSFLSMRYHLPGVFESLPYTGVVNGSLWSLQAEVWAYALLLLAGLLGLLKPGRYALAVLLGMALTLLLASQLTRLAPEIPPALGAFALGGLAAVHARRIPMHGSLPLLASVPFIAALLLDADPGIRRGLLLLVVASLTLWLAYRYPQAPGPHTDPSYGVYLYGFPVQQLWILALPGLPPLALTALALPVAWLLGRISWRWIEAPALRWKAADSPAPGGLRDARQPANEGSSAP